MSFLLVSDPFPESKSSLPVSIIDRRYGNPLKCEPRAKTDDPSIVRREKTKTPVRKKQVKKFHKPQQACHFLLYVSIYSSPVRC